MKKYITSFNLFVSFGLLVFFSSCTRDFDELNTDRTRIETLAPAQLDKLFSTAEYAGITNTDQWAGGYQLLTSLATDEQAQFFSCTQKNFPSDRNEMVGRWINGGWGSFLTGAAQTVLGGERLACLRAVSARSATNASLVARGSRCFQALPS